MSAEIVHDIVFYPGRSTSIAKGKKLLYTHGLNQNHEADLTFSIHHEMRINGFAECKQIGRCWYSSEGAIFAVMVYRFSALKMLV